MSNYMRSAEKFLAQHMDATAVRKMQTKVKQPVRDKACGEPSSDDISVVIIDTHRYYSPIVYQPAKLPKLHYESFSRRSPFLRQKQVPQHSDAEQRIRSASPFEIHINPRDYGYCEHCEVSYGVSKEHRESYSHKFRVNDESHWVLVDQLLSSLAH